MFSDQVPHKDYLSTIQLDLTLKLFSRARVISARRFKSWFLFNSSVVSPWIKTIQSGWSHLRWQRRRRSQVSSCTVPGVSPERCELGDEKLWWMFGLDLIRSTLKVCHEEGLSILPSSCCCNSRWALCSKGFCLLVCQVIYLLFYLWVGKVHNGFTGVEESLLVLWSGRLFLNC